MLSLSSLLFLLCFVMVLLHWIDDCVSLCGEWWENFVLTSVYHNKESEVNSWQCQYASVQLHAGKEHRQKNNREVAWTSTSWGMVKIVMVLLMFLVPGTCKASEATVSGCSCQSCCSEGCHHCWERLSAAEKHLHRLQLHTSVH